MSTKTNGGPAFPSKVEPSAQELAYGYKTQQFTGMTLRDYFAAKALVALFACEANPRVGREVEPYNSGEAHREYTAREAYAIADAMLAERAK